MFVSVLKEGNLLIFKNVNPSVSCNIKEKTYFARTSSDKCCKTQGCSSIFFRGRRSSARGLSSLAIMSLAPEDRCGGNLKSTLNWKELQKCRDVDTHQPKVKGDLYLQIRR